MIHATKPIVPSAYFTAARKAYFIALYIAFSTTYSTAYSTAICIAYWKAYCASK